MSPKHCKVENNYRNQNELLIQSVMYTYTHRLQYLVHKTAHRYCSA